ncbi:hypothetical protein EON82_15785 [bacterium]|nr:MAG: hypothetical protein EON82_15785 [bacterium]
MGRRDILGIPKSRFLPWVVLVLGLATTLGLFGVVTKALRDRNDGEFVKDIGRLERDIEALIEDQVGVLYAAAAAVAANPDINRDEFRSFYETLKKGKAAAVPTSVGFSMGRPWTRREELVTEAVKRRIPHFQFTPNNPRPEVYAAMLLEPYRGAKQSSYGSDIRFEPVRTKAVDEARRTGMPRMTSKVVLTRDEGQPEAAFVLYLPVYKDNDRSEEIGLVHLGLRTQGLFAPLLKTLNDSRIGLRLWSGSKGPQDEVFEFQADEPHERKRSVRIELPSVGQIIDAEFVTLPGYGSKAVIQPFVLPVGSLLSILLFALASVLGRAQESSERRESHQKLLAEAGRLTSDSIEDDQILSEIAVAIGTTFDAVCRIDLLDEGGTLRTVSTRQERNEALEELEREFPRLQSDILLRKALETGQTQRSDTGYLTMDDQHRARVAALEIGPVAVIPMRVREREIGAITLTRPLGKTPFEPDMIVLTEAIAARIGLAVDNARLYHAAQGEIQESKSINDELERRVAERTRDLEASNHELESFCYSVSHDLRTPLRSLDGFSRALKEDYGDRLDDQGLDFLDRIRAAAKRMDELITALLTLSRLTRSEILPTQVDVSGVARDLAQDLDPDGRVQFTIEDGLQVHVDPRMFEVLLENLLSNAVKFSSRVEKPRVEVGCTPDGWLFVRDNGAGYDPQYSSKLFQPFERLHSVREFPGHGIGLATVARIARRHAGEVKAEGKPGMGATFYVRFPKLDPADVSP